MALALCDILVTGASRDKNALLFTSNGWVAGQKVIVMVAVEDATATAQPPTVLNLYSDFASGPTQDMGVASPAHAFVSGDLGVWIYVVTADFTPTGAWCLQYDFANGDSSRRYFALLATDADPTGYFVSGSEVSGTATTATFNAAATSNNVFLGLMIARGSTGGGSGHTPNESWSTILAADCTSGAGQGKCLMFQAAATDTTCAPTWSNVDTTARAWIGIELQETASGGSPPLTIDEQQQQPGVRRTIFAAAPPQYPLTPLAPTGGTTFENQGTRPRRTQPRQALLQLEPPVSLAALARALPADAQLPGSPQRRRAAPQDAPLAALAAAQLPSAIAEPALPRLLRRTAAPPAPDIASAVAAAPAAPAAIDNTPPVPNRARRLVQVLEGILSPLFSLFGALPAQREQGQPQRKAPAAAGQQVPLQPFVPPVLLPHTEPFVLPPKPRGLKRVFWMPDPSLESLVVQPPNPDPEPGIPFRYRQTTKTFRYPQSSASFGYKQPTLRFGRPRRLF